MFYAKYISAGLMDLLCANEVRISTHTHTHRNRAFAAISVVENVFVLTCFRGENGSICFYMVFFEGADMAQMADIIAAEKARNGFYY